MLYVRAHVQACICCNTSVNARTVSNMKVVHDVRMSTMMKEASPTASFDDVRASHLQLEDFKISVCVFIV